MSLEDIRYRRALGLLPYEDLDPPPPMPVVPWEDLRQDPPKGPGIQNVGSRNYLGTFLSDPPVGGFGVGDLIGSVPKHGADVFAAQADDSTFFFLPGLYRITFVLQPSGASGWAKRWRIQFVPFDALVLQPRPFKGAGRAAPTDAPGIRFGASTSEQEQKRAPIVMYFPERWKILLVADTFLADADALLLTTSVELLLGLDGMQIQLDEFQQ